MAGFRFLPRKYAYPTGFHEMNCRDDCRTTQAWDHPSPRPRAVRSGNSFGTAPLSLNPRVTPPLPLDVSSQWTGSRRSRGFGVIWSRASASSPPCSPRVTPFSTNAIRVPPPSGSVLSGCCPCSGRCSISCLASTASAAAPCRSASIKSRAGPFRKTSARPSPRKPGISNNSPAPSATSSPNR